MSDVDEYAVLADEDEIVHILVVDDDRRLRELLRKYLTEQGFRVTSAQDAKAARRCLGALQFDLLVLDVMMPGETGLEFAGWLRSNSNVPILMLTAMTETEDRISGLEAGVDDYLPKPFEPRELVLRIRSILRRSGVATEAASTMVRLGSHHFDIKREILLQGQDQIRLTSTETALLRILASKPGRVMARAELTRLCDIEGGDRAVDVQVARLRRKIEPDPKLPRYLQTVRGRGYVVRPD